MTKKAENLNNRLETIKQAGFPQLKCSSLALLSELCTLTHSSDTNKTACMRFLLTL